MHALWFIARFIIRLWFDKSSSGTEVLLVIVDLFLRRHRINDLETLQKGEIRFEINEH